MAAGLLPSRLLPRRNECADARRLRSKLWAATVLSQSLGSWCTKWSNEKAEPPPTRSVNRDSGTTSANGGWLRRLVRPLAHNHNHQPNLYFRRRSCQSIPSPPSPASASVVGSGTGPTVRSTVAAVSKNDPAEYTY